jgi:hypothetical protein
MAYDYDDGFLTMTMAYDYGLVIVNSHSHRQQTFSSPTVIANIPVKDKKMHRKTPVY